MARADATPNDQCSVCRGAGARYAPEFRSQDFMMGGETIAMCDACGGTGKHPGAEAIANAERRISEAMSAMERRLAEAMFPVYEGPAEKPPPAWRRTAWGMRLRLRAWWYGMREWIAVHVLRVEVASEQEDW